MRLASMKAMSFCFTPDVVIMSILKCFKTVCFRQNLLTRILIKTDSHPSKTARPLFASTTYSCWRPTFIYNSCLCAASNSKN